MDLLIKSSHLIRYAESGTVDIQKNIRYKYNVRKINIFMRERAIMNVIEEFRTEIFDKFIDKLTTFLPDFILAIVIFIVSMWLINVICNSMKKILGKSKIEKTLHAFTISALKVSLRIIVIIIVADILGLPMGTFIAALGAAGVAIALAVKDNLADFTSGILLIVTKPFKIGDIIEAEGSTGTVAEIQLTYSVLKTADNKKVIIPNSKLANSKVINLSSEDRRRVELSFYMRLNTDMDKVKKIICNVLEKNIMSHNEPLPIIGISGQTINSLVIDVKVWCNTADYWTLYYDLNESLKKEFDKQDLLGANVQ